MPHQRKERWKPCLPGSRANLLIAFQEPRKRLRQIVGPTTVHVRRTMLESRWMCWKNCSFRPLSMRTIKNGITCDAVGESHCGKMQCKKKVSHAILAHQM